MQPTVGLGTILWHTLAVVIHIAETILSLGYPLIGGFAIPTSGLNTILRNPPSFIKAQAQSILCFRISLLGGFVVPVESFIKVLRNALAHVVQITEGVLGFHVALVCRFAIPMEGLPVVLRYTLAMVIHQGECVLREGVSLLSSRMAGLCILNKSFLNASIVNLPDERYPTDSNNTYNSNNNPPRKSQFVTLPEMTFDCLWWNHCVRMQHFREAWLSITILQAKCPGPVLLAAVVQADMAVHLVADQVLHRKDSCPGLDAADSLQGDRQAYPTIPPSQE